DAAHGRAARCKDDALDLGLARRLEDVVGPGDVDVAEGFPGRATELGGEMHHRVDALESGPNGVEVRDVGAMAGNAVHGAPVEGGDLEALADLLPEGAADEPAQARDEDARLRHQFELFTNIVERVAGRVPSLGAGVRSGCVTRSPESPPSGRRT